MKKLFLMFVAAGLFSFATTSCDSGKENAAEEQAEAAEDVADDADMPAAEEAAEEAEDSIDAADPR
ncbi:MAG: hypothetical protein JWQ14_1699 [Adhaeribacter sp.]|nr:hypothetical protein [Adhaeribacter sp.]